MLSGLFDFYKWDSGGFNNKYVKIKEVKTTTDDLHRPMLGNDFLSRRFIVTEALHCIINL